MLIDLRLIETDGAWLKCGLTLRFSNRECAVKYSVSPYQLLVTQIISSFWTLVAKWGACVILYWFYITRPMRCEKSSFIANTFKTIKNAQNFISMIAHYITILFIIIEHSDVFVRNCGIHLWPIKAKMRSFKIHLKITHQEFLSYKKNLIIFSSLGDRISTISNKTQLINTIFL